MNKTDSSWLFFDLDDTLWDFSFNSHKSLRFVFTFFPQIKEEFNSFEEFLNIYHGFNSELWERFSRAEISSDVLKMERWKKTLESKGLNLSDEKYKEIDDTYLRTLSTFPKTIDNALSILEEFSKTHLIGVISNGFSKTQYSKAQNSGLDKYITRLIVSDEIGIPKPDKKIFDYAITATGVTGDPIMIGDNPNTDIMGALKAGWYAIWLNINNKPNSIIFDEIEKAGCNKSKLLGIVSSLSQIKEILSSLK